MKKRTKIRSTGRFKIWYIPLMAILLLIVVDMTTSIINSSFNVENLAATYNCDVRWLFKLKTTIEVDGEAIDESASLPDEAIIMLFASYYSDYDADSQNKSSHSRSSKGSN